MDHYIHGYLLESEPTSLKEEKKSLNILHAEIFSVIFVAQVRWKDHSRKFHSSFT